MTLKSDEREAIAAYRMEKAMATAKEAEDKGAESTVGQ